MFNAQDKDALHMNAARTKQSEGNCDSIVLDPVKSCLHLILFPFEFAYVAWFRGG